MLHKLIEGKSLSEEETCSIVTELLNDPIKMAGFLSLLRAKGETVEEILGLVKAMRAKMRKLDFGFPTIDIVGTGGDQAGTVNLSTGAALLAAECGAKVVKHGNRAVSSKCGSADVLEELGEEIHMSGEELRRSVERRGFAFCFAPDYHPAMKELRAMRQALKMPTAFNLIGPLLNPASIDHLLFGVHKPELVPMLANVLFRLGTKRSLVFSGCGIDELSCIGKTEAILVTENGMEPFTIDPEGLGFKICTLNDLKGGDAKYNAAILKNPMGAILDALVLNAGVALFLVGLTKTVIEGVQMARRQSIKNALCKKGVIAEIKRASPSKGRIGERINPIERAKQFERAGAAVISVLTSDRFEGSLDDLHQVKQAVSIPVLRKDFITTKEELAKTKADLVLLIVSYLGERTKEMLVEAKKLGLQPLVEVHSAAELEIALNAGADIIGVNQRDLKDFTMHPEVYELIQKIPKEVIKVAESGVKDLEDAKRLFAMGYDAILVGEALTRRPELCEELCSLKSAG